MSCDLSNPISVAYKRLSSLLGLYISDKDVKIISSSDQILIRLSEGESSDSLTVVRQGRDHLSGFSIKDSHNTVDVASGCVGALGSVRQGENVLGVSAVVTFIFICLLQSLHIQSMQRKLARQKLSAIRTEI